MDMNRKEAGEGLILCTKDAKAGKKISRRLERSNSCFCPSETKEQINNDLLLQ